MTNVSLKSDSYRDWVEAAVLGNLRREEAVTPRAYLTLSVGILGLLILFISWIQNSYFHPLSRFPGPPLWKFSRLPYVISLMKGDFVHDIKAIHDKYGRTVRVAPNELSVIEADAWQDIYGYKKERREFVKNPIWARPSPNGVKSILHADPQDHDRQRRLLAPAFSARALREHQATIHFYINKLVQNLKSKADSSSAVVDLKDYYFWTAFDIIGDLGYGESFNCLNLERYNFWISFLFDHLKTAVLRACANFFPGVSSLLLWFMPKAVFDAALMHHQLSSDKLHRRIALEGERNDILSYILKDIGGGMSLKELEATSSAIILAGAEAPSTTLIVITNYLLRNPTKLEKLVDEIRTACRSEEDIKDDLLKTLPYLKAVVQEGFRIAPPIPIGIPRIVPPEGAVVADQMIPGDTFIAVPQYAANRFAEYFAFPDDFLPERWLAPDSGLCQPGPGDPEFSGSTFAADNRQVVKPFSVGPRDCLGKELGFTELRLILVHILWNFDIAVPEGGEMAPFTDNKTFALWERKPCEVQITCIR